jgi:hypothetical protein
MTINSRFSRQGRARAILGCLVASLALVCVALPATASDTAVTTTTVDVDSLAVGARVSQYPAADPEITFPVTTPGFTSGATPGNGVLSDQDCLGAPVVEAVPDTHTPPNALQLPLCGGGEFPDHGVFAALTGTADAVSAYVGDPDGFDDPFELDAYDSAGNLLGTSTVTTSGDGISTQISYRQPGVFTIAYIALYLLGATDHDTIGMDDFSVEWGGGVPAITLASVPGGTLAPGVTVQRTLTIGRLNGSDGNVGLSLTGLPATDQVTFSPSVLSGTSTTSQVTISVAGSAQPGDAVGTVTATPQTPEAGRGPASAPLGVAVVAPFSVSDEFPTMSVEPCSKAATEVTTRVAGGFAGTPIDLGVSETGSSPDFSSIAVQDALLSNPGDFPGGANTQPLTVVRDEQPGPLGSFDLIITPVSGTVTEPALTIRVDRASPQITSVFRTSDDLTPQGGQPGSLVTIDGAGFCPNAVVEFGNLHAVATPVSVNPAGTEITVRVPRLATDGPLTVENIPAGSTIPSSSATSAQPVTINSYRNVNGYQFHNYTPHVVFSQLTEAFGEGQTYISVNLCIVGCTIHIRNPLAQSLNAVVNAAIGGSASGGACFGFSLSTQRILLGQKSFSDFPNNSNGTIYGLDSPAGPSGPLTDYINAMAASQFSGTFLHHWLSQVASHIGDGGSASAQDVYGEIQSILAQGRYPMISLRDGSKGHEVVAYNLEGTPGNYFIDVYDSNDQFQSAENSDADFHQTAVNESRISVDSRGDWSLQSTTMQGGMPGLVVTDPASLPQDPPMITSLSGLVDLFFGSAGPGDPIGTGAAGPPPSTVTQLSDSSGHTLYNPDGSLNTSPATRLDASPYAPLVAGSDPAAPASARPQEIVVANAKSALHATVSETGPGTDTHTFLGPGLVAQVSTPASPGVTDTLTIVPSGGAGLATSATSKPVNLTLTAAHGDGARAAEISTTATRGGGVTATFNAARSGLTLVNQGKATTFRTTLSDTEPGATPAAFESGPIRIGANSKATIESVRWNSLTGSTVKIRTGGRIMTIHNTYRPVALASVASLHAGTAHHRKVVLAIHAKVRKLPAGTQLAFTWIVKRDGKTVATHSLLTAPSIRTARYTFTAKTPGRYALTAAVTAVILSGLTATVRKSVSRTRQFRA